MLKKVVGRFFVPFPTVKALFEFCDKAKPVIPVQRAKPASPAPQAQTRPSTRSSHLTLHQTLPPARAPLYPGHTAPDLINQSTFPTLSLIHPATTTTATTVIVLARECSHQNQHHQLHQHHHQHLHHQQQLQEQHQLRVVRGQRMKQC